MTSFPQAGSDAYTEAIERILVETGNGRPTNSLFPNQSPDEIQAQARARLGRVPIHKRDNSEYDGLRFAAN